MTVTPPALLRDLRTVGYQVKDLWGLINSNSRYPRAVPVLIDWLGNLDERVGVGVGDLPAIRESLVRALSVPSARPTAAKTLIHLFRRVDDPSGLGPRWNIGNALYVVADDSVFPDIESLVRNRSYGKARQMVVLGLGRFTSPQVVPLLLEQLSDDDVAAHAVMALGKLKPPGVRDSVAKLLENTEPLVRREVRKTLSRLPM